MRWTLPVNVCGVIATAPADAPTDACQRCDSLRPSLLRRSFLFPSTEALALASLESIVCADRSFEVPSRRAKKLCSLLCLSSEGSRPAPVAIAKIAAGFKDRCGIQLTRTNRTEKLEEGAEPADSPAGAMTSTRNMPVLLAKGERTVPSPLPTRLQGGRASRTSRSICRGSPAGPQAVLCHRCENDGPLVSAVRALAASGPRRQARKLRASQSAQLS